MTNREWLESLSDEELAIKLHHLSDCEAQLTCEGCVFVGLKGGCSNLGIIEDWLKAERSENE